MNKKYLLLYALMAILIIIKEYGLLETKSKIPITKPILTLDVTPLKSYLQTYDENRSLNHYWGFTKEKKVIATDTNKTKKESKIGPIVKQTKNRLCIDDSCYRLIGIHYSKNTPFVTLYNKEQTKRFKDYTTNDTLEANITIADIKSNSVIFRDQNKTKIWKFKLFDVNTTKYKPKDTNETKY